MESRALSRAMVESVVDRSLREIVSDPDRSLRKLVDLGNLLANELYAPQGAGQTALDSILAGIKRLQACCETLVIVTNEVFSDGLPYADETVRYIALLGRLNTELAAQADAVYESVCGLLLPVKEGKNG